MKWWYLKCEFMRLTDGHRTIMEKYVEAPDQNSVRKNLGKLARSTNSMITTMQVREHLGARPDPEARPTITALIPHKKQPASSNVTPISLNSAQPKYTPPPDPLAALTVVEVNKSTLVGLSACTYKEERK